MNFWQQTAVGVVLSLLAWGGNEIYSNLKQEAQASQEWVRVLSEIVNKCQPDTE